MKTKNLKRKPTPFLQEKTSNQATANDDAKAADESESELEVIFFVD